MIIGTLNLNILLIACEISGSSNKIGGGWKDEENIKESTERGTENKMITESKEFDKFDNAI
jgi:hypothetical protein